MDQRYRIKLQDSSLLLPCFLLGVCATMVLKYVAPINWLIVLLTTICLCLLFRKRIVFLLPIMTFGIGFSWACYCFSQQIAQALPDNWQKVNLVVTGQVIGLPQVSYASTKFDFQLDSIEQSSGSKQNQLSKKLIGAKIELKCYRCKETFLPNQQWKFQVRLKRPHGYASWGAYDYQKYLFRKRIMARGYIKNTTLIQSPKDLSIRQRSDNLRWKVREYLTRRLPEQSVGRGILAALMIGDKSLLSNEQKTVLQKAGLSHLIAISGLHIGLVFMLAQSLFNRLFNIVARVYYYLPRQHLVLLPSLLCAILYAALAGFAVSTQRAIIMLSIYVLCKVMARQVNLLRVLLIAASVIVVVDPNSILDVGFWLSFTAVFVIALMQINRDRAASNNELNDSEQGPLDIKALSKNQTTSLWRLQPVLWFGMLPLSVLFFSQISFISPFINLIAVPLFCLILVPAALLSLIAYLLQFVSVSNYLIGLLDFSFNYLYNLLIYIVDLPLSNWLNPNITVAHAVLFSIIVIAYTWSHFYRHYVWLLFIPSLLYSVFFSKPQTLYDGEALRDMQFIVTLLDVGQGLSMVVETRNHVLIYDTGPAYPSGFSVAKIILLPYLATRNIKSIDRLIVSHADNDHIGGYPDLLSAMRISSTLTSRLDKIPDAHKNNAQACTTGESWKFDGVHFEILSPDYQQTPKGSNNYSCVLKISNEQSSILLAGDIERPVEINLVENLPAKSLSADVMLIPHHGSKTSSSEGFIDAVKPKLALLSAGYLNYYGHPSKSVMQRYKQRDIPVLSTIEHGSIQLFFDNIVSTDQTKLQWRSYRIENKHFWWR